jgi:hypothetical protein
MKKCALSPEFKQKALAMGAYDYNEYEIIAEVGSGICLPGKKNFKVRIAINDYFFDTPAPKEPKANYCRWSHRFDVTSFKGPYKSI